MRRVGGTKQVFAVEVKYPGPSCGPRQRLITRIMVTYVDSPGRSQRRSSTARATRGPRSIGPSAPSHSTAGLAPDKTSATATIPMRRSSPAPTCRASSHSRPPASDARPKRSRPGGRASVAARPSTKPRPAEYRGIKLHLLGGDGDAPASSGSACGPTARPCSRREATPPAALTRSRSAPRTGTAGSSTALPRLGMRLRR